MYIYIYIYIYTYTYIMLWIPLGCSLIERRTFVSSHAACEDKQEWLCIDIYNFGHIHI